MDQPSCYRIDRIKTDNSLVETHWHDGHVSRFPGIWLLESCQCEACGSSETAVRHTSLLRKPVRPHPASVDFDENCLHVVWDETHASDYDLVWQVAPSFRDPTLPKKFYLRLTASPQNPGIKFRVDKPDGLTANGSFANLVRKYAARAPVIRIRTNLLIVVRQPGGPVQRIVDGREVRDNNHNLPFRAHSS